MLSFLKREKSKKLENQLNTLQKEGPAAWADLPEDELFTPAGFSEERAEATSYSNYSYWGSTFRAFFKNKVAVALLIALVAVVAFAFLQPYLPGQADPNLCAVDPATASEYSYMLSDIGQVVNAAEIIAGEKPVTDLGVTAVDDKTLEVQLNVPVSYFLSLMYFPTFYPVNEAFYNTCKDTFGTSPDTVLSNGAFKLTDYQPAATAFTLEKNPDYYDAGKIALDGLAYQVIKDSQQALMSYQTGTLDITLSKEAPEDPSNWLPVSDGEFHLFMRIYLPDMNALDAWQPPVIHIQE